MDPMGLVLTPSVQNELSTRRSEKGVNSTDTLNTSR